MATYTTNVKRLWADSGSQSFQESFVINANKEKMNGFYVEIGSNHPSLYSNTFILESVFNWNGVAFELASSLVDLYNFHRRNRSIAADATSFDFRQLFQELQLPNNMEYLQLDIEPAENTFMSLKRIPLNEYRFAVITFEHDLYSNPNNIHIQTQAYELLSSYEYVRVVKNICSNGKPYEDWYVHPQLVDVGFIEEWTMNDVEDTALFSGSELA